MEEKKHTNKAVGKRKKRKKKNLKKTLVIIVIILIFFIWKIVPSYKDDSIKDRTNLIVNNKNVTEDLQKNGTYVYRDENNIIYLSFEDVANLFDSNLYLDETYNQIITTCGSQIATIEIGKQEMYVNSAKIEIYGTVIKKDGKIYLPFSEMENVYNVEINYIEANDTVVIESLNKKLTRALVNRNTNIKVEGKNFCRTVEKIKKGDSVIIVEEHEDWTKIRTANGNIGFLKTKVLNNITEIRSDMIVPKQIEGNVNIMWETTLNKEGETIDGTNVVSPPFLTLTKNGKEKINTNIGNTEKEYIKWAQQNGYKIWPMFSNASLTETTSEIIRDYKLRETLINNIMDILVEYELDGINIDFKNMNIEEKDMFSRFIIELKPRLKEFGMILSVNITETEKCYDRNILEKVVDYLIFTTKDEHNEFCKITQIIEGQN